jgi:hypothetical protein
MLNRTRVILGFLFLTCSVVACAVLPEDEGESDAANLTGSLANAKGCAVRDAYARAELTDLANVSFDELPAAVRAAVGSDAGDFGATAKFDVPGVGVVYIVESSPLEGNSILTLADAHGTVVVMAAAKADSTVWFLKGAGELQCASPPPPPPPDEAGAPNPAADAGPIPPIPDAGVPDEVSAPPEIDAGLPDPIQPEP